MPKNACYNHFLKYSYPAAQAANLQSSKAKVKALILTGPEQSTIRYLENFSFSPGRVVGIAREVMISMLTGNGNPNQRENGCTGPRPGIAKMKGNRDSALVNLYFLKRDHSKILQIPQPG